MNEELRILILGDSIPDAELIIHELKSLNLKLSTKFASTKKEYLTELEQFIPDIILSEYNLASFDSMEALNIASEFCSSRPFILVSGSIDEEIALKYLTNGATDYVYLKHLAKLSFVIKRTFSEIIEKKQRKLAECFLNIQNSLTRILTESNSMNEANPKILQSICQGMGWEVGQIWRVEPSTNNLICAGTWADDLINLEDFITVSEEVKFSPGELSIRNSWEMSETNWINNLPDNSNSPWIITAQKNGLKSLIIFPIMNNNKVIGILSFFSIEIKQLDRHLNKMFKTLSQQIGNFIVNKSIEEKIREQATLLDIVQDAIIVCNLDYSIIFWNKGAEKLYGCKEEQVVNKKASQFIFNTVTFKFSDASETLENIGEWRGKIRYQTVDGREIIVESHWSLVKNNQGKPESILMVNRDISEKEKFETKFYRAQRMESIGTLTGGIAHDLNNILTPILIAINILQLKSLDHQSSRIINSLETNVKRGADIIKQLLMFARGAEGEHIVFKPKQLIRETEKMIRETFPKSIDISTEIAGDILSVTGDETQLYQVILNLCVNARDAMPDGGILVVKANNIMIDESYTKMNPEAKIGPHIVISVVDTGKGIPANILDNIFEPFFTTKSHGEGTGLGLSTVVGIVKSHGGFINVYSELNKGTIFRVYLPAVQNSDAKAVKLQKLNLPVGNGELILIAEDEASIRDIAKETMEAYGYNVLTADDGIEAISVYLQNKDKIKVVLLDMTMPFMDGPITIKALQKINPNIKIILMSGLAENFKKVEKSIFSFLHKPYTAEELLSNLAKCLSISEKQAV